MAEATETQDQANARRRDEITANLDQLAINRPNEYTTLVGALAAYARGRGQRKPHDLRRCSSWGVGGNALSGPGRFRC